MTPEAWARLTPDQQSAHAAQYGPPPPDYLAAAGPPGQDCARRAAEAAERTRRNTTILVWALVGIPAVVAVVVVLVIVLGQAVAGNRAAAERDGFARVEAVYREVGYAPHYSDIRSQASGICEHLGAGMSTDEAAGRMATGFRDDGLTYVQAQKIAVAVSENMC